MPTLRLNSSKQLSIKLPTQRRNNDKKIGQNSRKQRGEDYREELFLKPFCDATAGATVTASAANINMDLYIITLLLQLSFVGQF